MKTCKECVFSIFDDEGSGECQPTKIFVWPDRGCCDSFQSAAEIDAMPRHGMTEDESSEYVVIDGYLTLVPSMARRNVTRSKKKVLEDALL
jgi:hypothetical protein